MLCERKLNSAFTEFSRPEWRTWTKVEIERREPLFREMMLHEYSHVQNPVERQQRVERTLDLAKRGELTMQEAELPLGNAKQTWVRFGIRSPEDSDWRIKSKEGASNRKKLGLEERFGAAVGNCSWVRYFHLEQDGARLKQNSDKSVSGSGARDEWIFHRQSGEQIRFQDAWAHIAPDMGTAILDVGMFCRVEYRIPQSKRSAR